MLKELLLFMYDQRQKLAEQVLTHLQLVLESVALACLIAIPAGVLLGRSRRLAGLFLGIAGAFQTIPSIALLGILIPLLGIGIVPALFALFIYALLPILSNTYTGITQVDPLLEEAARAMGMNHWQKLIRVELPLASPVILAGVKTAAVINVGVATLAAYVGAGGLGEFIFGGISLNNPVMMLAGAIPSALLAILIDLSLGRAARLSRARLLLFLGTGAAVIVALWIYVEKPYKSWVSGRGSAKQTILAGFTPEFIGRSDGLPGLQRVYGFKLKTLVINDAIMYKALQEKKLDVISGYSTDGRLKAYDLLILKDDKHVFPPYYAAPLLRKAVMQKYPVLKSVFEKLQGKISDSAMTAMNFELDYKHTPPEEIATSFLKSRGLYRQAQPAGTERIILGAKIFGEQQILINIYSKLIRGYTNLETVLKPNLGGTQICFAALEKGGIDMYPEYSGTAMLVLLHPPARELPRLMKNKDSLFLYDQVNLERRFGMIYLAPAGFNNSYALMMRRVQAKSLRLESISDLTRKF